MHPVLSWIHLIYSMSKGILSCFSRPLGLRKPPLKLLNSALQLGPQGSLGGQQVFEATSHLSHLNVGQQRQAQGLEASHAVGN